MTDLLYLLAAFFFLLLNAFFVLAEFAVVKVRFTRLEELAARGITRAKVAKEAVRDLEAYLSTAQLGITIASIGLGWVGEPAVAHLVSPALLSLGLTPTPAATHTVSIALSFGVITAFHVVLGELVPKNMAIRMPERSALWIAVPFKIFHTVFFVPMWVLNESANLVLRLLRIKASQEEAVHSDEELRMILGQSEEHGRISLGRLMMFEHLFDFGKTRVKEIMTPRGAIYFIDVQKPWADNLALIREKKFSRYPIADGTMDKADGFVHFKDVALDAITSGPDCGTADILKHRRELGWIPEDLTAEKALREFQEKRMQIALCKNPKGEITGLLTMEDIVEELTGEIRDEFEQPPTLLLSQLIALDSCEFDLGAVDRFEAIKKLLGKLHAAHPCFDKDAALKAIIARENNFSTALGHGTAFPHARLETLSRPIVAVGTSREGIYFPAPDNLPVKAVFLILTPFNEPKLQLNLLKQLSELVSNLTLRKRLMTARSCTQLADIIRAFENKVMK